jgi:hypothetical protein
MISKEHAMNWDSAMGDFLIVLFVTFGWMIVIGIIAKLKGEW